MEDYALDVMIGKGPSARSLRLSLKPFTVVGATTRAGRISGPLRDRFGATYRLDFYTDDELDRDRRPLGGDPRRRDRRRPRRGPSPGAAAARRASSTGCSSASATTPRSTATAASTRRPRREAMRAMEIDDEGLDSTDRKLLAAIVQKFASGPVGVAALAAVLSEEIETIEDVYEPFLLRLGFIDRTPQGRIATDLARAHLSGARLRDPAAAPREAGMPSLWDDPPGDAAARGGRVTAGYVGQAARYEVQVPPPADGSTRARLGRLTLTHGVVETPQFMPVGTNATVKALDPDEIARDRRLDHPRQHVPPVPAPGPRAHRAARRPAPVHGLGRPDPDRLGRVPGRLARRPAGRRRRRRHVPLPSRRLHPPVHARARDRASRRRSARTSRSPSTSRSSRPRRGPSWPTRPSAPTAGRSARWPRTSATDQALFGIVQGGLDPDLRAESTRVHRGLPFDGICIGGLAGDETPAQRDATLDVAVPLLDDDPRPRYLMGLGSPADLLEAVHRGVDLFDSVLPARVARNGQLWVPGGRLNLRNRAFLRRPGARSRRTARASPAGGSRGPTWPICSGPRSCSRTASRLVTT